MENVETRIAVENIRYNKLKNKYYWLGAVFVGVAVFIGIIFSQISEMSPIIAGLSITLYMGFGISILMKSISVNQDRERGIREIKMDDKLDKIFASINEKETISIKKQVEDASSMSDNDFKNALEEWKIVVKTQMHFNEMLMKIRAGVVSVVYAVFGAGAYALQFKELWIVIGGIKVHASFGLVVVGILILIGIFYLDYKYYYRMLIGATNRADEIAEEFKNFKGRKYFSLSLDIRESISNKKGASELFVKLFYYLPILGGISFLIFIMTIYNI